jgi:hypothetical protein
MEKNNLRLIHDKCAPYWAIFFFILLITGLSTIWFDLGSFGNGYVLDMVGPSWAYILFRGLYTSKADNLWTHFFTPFRTLMIFLIVCFGIETLQYFEIYDSTFDFWDLIAYISILIPLFIVDTRIIQKGEKSHSKHHLNAE